MTDREMFDRLAALWRERDPVPDGLVARMQRYARAEADLVDTDWDHELMQLVERSAELAGARGGGTATYTLRFSHGDVDLLLRIAGAWPRGARIDGWVVPPLPMTVRMLGADGSDHGASVAVGDNGRFELTGAAGLVRLVLEPEDPERTTVLTPAFEI